MNDVRGDVRRLVRMLDGDGASPGLAVRLDRLEKRGESSMQRIERIESLGLWDNPLIVNADDLARRAAEHVERAEDRALTQRNVYGFFARELFTWGLQLATVIALGYLAVHGVPLAR